MYIQNVGTRLLGITEYMIHLLRRNAIRRKNERRTTERRKTERRTTERTVETTEHKKITQL
jgi:hypothetical protein